MDDNFKETEKFLGVILINVNNLVCYISYNFLRGFLFFFSKQPRRL